MRACIGLAFALELLTGCAHRAVDDRGSRFALEAGQATMTLGGCQRPLAVGYDACQLERGSKMPELRLAFLNPAEYSISDCQFGIFKSGSVPGASVVELDLSPLSDQIAEAGFCFLKVEAVEHYPDPKAPDQKHPVPLAGGFILELFETGYLPKPDPSLVAWCYQVERTTKGRTEIRECP